MVKLALESGKFIIKNGKVAVVEDGKSSCGCCCNDCCWKIASMTGCPAPEVDVDIDNNKISFTFLDSESCGEIGTPQPCRPNPNADDTTDKTTCNQLQYMILTNEWTIKETTNITIDLSGTSETSAPDKDYIDITLTPLSGQKIIGDGGDPRFRPAGTYHARIASDDGELGTSEDGCDMNDISGSWNFELEPGCWSVKVYSCTRDAFSHIGMKNSVSFSFDPEKPQNCKDHLCTTVECGSIIEGSGIRNEVNPRTGKGDYGFALIDSPLTECTIMDFDEESGGEPQSVKDCIKVCEQKPDNPCKRISYYCCVDGVCNRFTKKLCGTDTKSSDEKSGVDGEADVGGGVGDNFCSENGPYYCTLQQCTDSEECKVKYCCDADGEVCRPCNKVTQSSDEKNGVDGNGFDTLEECRQTCEVNAKYNCDTGINGENAECVKAQDPNNASYDNIDACIADCEEDKGNRYTCTEAGECVRNAFGEYENEDACVNDCGGDGEGKKWYCCYDGPAPKAGAKDTRKTFCQKEPDVPQFDQNGNPIPVCQHGSASGPHSAKLCSIVCGGYDCVRRCDGTKICQRPKNGGDGKYATLRRCLSDCRTMKGPKPPCELAETNNANINVDNDDANAAFDREWKWFEIDEYERQICISYSTNGKPIRIQTLVPILDANCNVIGTRPGVTSPWYGEKDCDCEARKNAGGSFDSTLKGEVKWKKPRGLGLFFVRILSCDINSYEVEVGCDQCKQVDDKETIGACCYYDLDNGDFLGCDENDIPKKICEDPKENSDGQGGIKRVIGKFLGPCSKCQDKDGNDNCLAKKGACCIDDNEAVKQCRDRLTKKKCEEELGGDYQGDDTWCDEPENRNNPQIDKDKIILCPGLGACCTLNWKEIPVSDCSVVDYIEVGGQKGSISDTKKCSDSGECAGIEVNVKNKNIKCIEASQENKDLLGDKIPVVKVLTSVILPEKNCDGSTVEAKGNTTEMIPLEDYPESYEPPFTIKTKAQQFGNGIKNQKIGAKNGGEVGDIVTIKADGKVVQVWKAIGYECSHKKEKDCDDQEGIFTKDQNCCKTFAENKIDCEEPWCDQEIQAARFSSYSYEDSPIEYGNTRVIKKSDSSGPGTELKKLLSKIGINASENCSCNSRARIMDRWGPEGCEEEIGTIVGWLKEEAKKRGLPFVEIAGYILVKRAIHNARKNRKD